MRAEGKGESEVSSWVTSWRLEACPGLTGGTGASIQSLDGEPSQSSVDQHGHAEAGHQAH
jgi:hypothetical protein